MKTILLTAGAAFIILLLFASICGKWMKWAKNEPADQPEPPVATDYVKDWYKDVQP